MLFVLGDFFGCFCGIFVNVVCFWFCLLKCFFRLVCKNGRFSSGSTKGSRLGWGGAISPMTSHTRFTPWFLLALPSSGLSEADAYLEDPSARRKQPTRSNQARALCDTCWLDQ